MSTGRGHLLHGGASFAVHFEDRDWWLQIRRLDGEAHPPFAQHDQRPVRGRDLVALLPAGGALRWEQARTLPGLPESARATSPPFELYLVGAEGTEVTWERMAQECQAWLKEERGRRLV